jgi:hypothetical protein
MGSFSTIPRWLLRRSLVMANCVAQEQIVVRVREIPLQDYLQVIDWPIRKSRKDGIVENKDHGFQVDCEVICPGPWVDCSNGPAIDDDEGALRRICVACFDR